MDDIDPIGRITDISHSLGLIFKVYEEMKTKNPTNESHLWGLCNLNNQWSRKIGFT